MVQKGNKKILIFYSKAGGGHLRCAQAIDEEIKAISEEYKVVLYDGLANTNLGVKFNPAFAWSILSNQLLPVFNFFYLLTNNRVGTKIMRGVIKMTWGKSVAKIINQESPDIIITTHHFISPSTINIKDLEAPYITVVTDLGIPHKIWFDKQADKIITPTEEMAKFAQHYLNDNNGKIVNLGYPVSKQFEQPAKIKDSSISNNILVLGGGVGSGNMEDQVKTLLAHFPDKKITAVCGFNKKLKESLESLKNKNLTALGFVDNMAELINNTDIVVSKAGPGTIAEVATIKKPMVLTSWVGMQEKDNINFVTGNHLGVYCPDVNNLPEAVNQIYQNYTKFIPSKSIFSKNTQDIARFISGLCEKEHQL